MKTFLGLAILAALSGCATSDYSQRVAAARMGCLGHGGEELVVRSPTETFVNCADGSIVTVPQE